MTASTMISSSFSFCWNRIKAAATSLFQAITGKERLKQRKRKAQHRSCRRKMKLTKRVRFSDPLVTEKLTVPRYTYEQKWDLFHPFCFAVSVRCPGAPKKPKLSRRDLIKLDKRVRFSDPLVTEKLIVPRYTYEQKWDLFHPFCFAVSVRCPGAPKKPKLSRRDLIKVDKKVRFAKELVTETHYRERTTCSENIDLYHSPIDYLFNRMFVQAHGYVDHDFVSIYEY